MLIEQIFYIILGLVLLVLGGNWLLKSAIGLSLQLKIPKAIIGMTVVSLATSFPELIVSLNAAIKGVPLIALGNVIGSNISNIGLILSITAIFSAITISKNFFKFDFIVLMVISIGFILMLLDFKLTRIDGFILLTMFSIFIYLLLRKSKEAKEPQKEDLIPLSGWKILMFLILGGLGLWLGAEFLIQGAVNIATEFGISERIIGVTIVAVGTSIPELAASLIAIYKKENDISLGNIIGSNLFNLLLIMGAVSAIYPIAFTDEKVIQDALIMLGFSFLILPMALIPKKYIIGKYKGLIILLLYIGFIFLTIS